MRKTSGGAFCWGKAGRCPKREGERGSEREGGGEGAGALATLIHHHCHSECHFTLHHCELWLHSCPVRAFALKGIFGCRTERFGDPLGHLQSKEFLVVGQTESKELCGRVRSQRISGPLVDPTPKLPQQPRVKGILGGGSKDFWGESKDFWGGVKGISRPRPAPDSLSLAMLLVLSGLHM